MSVSLELKKLTKDFDTKGGFLKKGRPFRAVNNVSLQVEQGKALAIVGESGCGKSTLARLICQMQGYQATDGVIEIHGEVSKPIKRRADRVKLAQQVQMIFQDPYGALNPVHTIGWHMDRAARTMAPGDAEERKRIAIEALEACGLSPAKDVLAKHPYALSGGQRQRVCIARVLASGARIILADEPTSMLDVSIRIGILKLLGKLKETHDASFIFITHDLASARFFADDIMVMYAGHAVERGPAQSVIESPKHPYTQLLLASVPDPDRALSAEDAINTVIAEPPMWCADDVGCPFANRCPHVTDICRTQNPEWQSIGEQQAYCHHAIALTSRQI